MKVFFYLTCFFPDAKGATYDAVKLAQELRKNDIQISFLVSERYSGRPGEDSYQGFPVSFFALTLPGIVRKMPGVMDFLFRVWRKRDDFDILVIYGGTPVAILLGWLVKSLLNKKVILQCAQAFHDTPDGLHKRKYGGMALRLLKTLDAVVVMSAVQKKHTSSYPGLVMKIPNGVDINRFQPVDARQKAVLRKQHLGISENTIVLVYAGWLGYRKGTDILFSTWQKVRRKHPDTALLCVGDFVFGSRDQLKSFLTEYDIDSALADAESLYLVAMIEKIQEYMQVSDIFIFPSRGEGFGTVQIEAMACGLPCIVNDLADLSDALFPTEEIGIRIKHNDPDRFAQAIDGLISSPSKRRELGFKARTYAVTNFSLPVIVENYISLYTRLLNR